MKILDPQSALLTTAEVHQFMKDNVPREADKKIGSYPSVNLHNYRIVRSDFQNYTVINHPHIESHPPIETFMHDLILRLKPYKLTKAEVFVLINLGVGMPQHRPNVDKENLPDAADEEVNEEPPESELSKSLFRLVVEESEQRFEGDAGEAQIDEILAILKEAALSNVSGDATVVNGHYGATEGKVNGIERATG